MGNPSAPTLANIFLCNLEKRFLDTCPSEFKPVLYRRYLDDTFVLFRHQSHAALFVDYINGMHANIEFTAEIEKHNKLNFLDMLIYRENNKKIHQYTGNLVLRDSELHSLVLFHLYTK